MLDIDKQSSGGMESTKTLFVLEISSCLIRAEQRRALSKGGE
jgi:hypothetical protein